MLTVNWRTIYEVNRAFAALRALILYECGDVDSQFYISSIETDLIRILKGEIQVPGFVPDPEPYVPE